MHFGPFYLGSKGLQQACNKLELKHNGGGSFWEALVRPRVEKWEESPSLFVIPDKKQRAIIIKCAQTNFKSVLGHHASYRKKKLSKKLLKGANLVFQKGTK